MRILIVEDDLVIATALQDELSRHGLEGLVVQDFLDVADQVKSLEPHLILLDINLPYHNGYYWCSQIRTFSQVPIIFISSLTDTMDQMMAMQMGGDDFITKPIDLPLTMVKIQALLRRTYDYQDNVVNNLGFGEYQLDVSRSLFQGPNGDVDLTKTELLILQTLFQGQGEFVTREKILDQCWQNHQFIDDNTLAVNISRLRKKLGEIDTDDLIETKRGIGYRLRGAN